MDCRDSAVEVAQGEVPAPQRPQRSRAFLVTLLALLWASVGCVALLLGTALDLQETYEQASRSLATPRVPRPMRARAAPSDTSPEGVPSPFPNASAMGIDAVWAWDATVAGGVRGGSHEQCSMRTSSRHFAGRPHLATPQGRKLHDGLVAAAREEKDVNRRAGAVRSLAGMFGTDAAVALAGIADDPAQPTAVRELAGELGRRNVEGGK